MNDELRFRTRRLGACFALGLAALASFSYVFSPGHSVAALERTDHWPTIARHARSSVVRIRSASGIGSGVIIGYDRILTAAHVVDSGLEYTVEVYVDGGPPIPYIGTVIMIDRATDLAVLQLPRVLTNQAALGLGPADRLIEGVDALVCIGATHGLHPWNVTAGFLTSKGVPELAESGRGDHSFLWQMSTSAYFGNSGGAVFEPKDWTLVGVLVAGTNAPNLSFFVPINKVAEFLAKEGKPEVSPIPPAPPTCECGEGCPSKCACGAECGVSE